MKHEKAKLHISNEELKQAVNEWLAKYHPEIKPDKEWQVYPLSPEHGYLIAITLDV